MATDCKGIKRKLVVDWGRLRPPKIVITSEKKLNDSGNGVEGQENHTECLEHRMKSDRKTKFKDKYASFIKDMQLWRHERELERRKKLQSEKMHKAFVVTSKKNLNDVGNGVDSQPTHVEDLKSDKRCEETAPLFDHINSSRSPKTCLVDGRSQKISNDGSKDGDLATPFSKPSFPQDPLSINLMHRPTTLADKGCKKTMQPSARQNDRGASQPKQEYSPKSHCGVASGGSLTNKTMQTIVNALVNVGVTPVEVGMAAEVFYRDPVKVKVLFALPSDMRRSYVVGLLDPKN